jgi:hypothetical protein
VNIGIETDTLQGPNTKVMRKAKMSFQSGQVKQVIRTYAVEVQTGDKKDLEAETVEMKLRKAMGANCESIFFEVEKRMPGGKWLTCGQMIDRLQGTRCARKQYEFIEDLEPKVIKHVRNASYVRLCGVDVKVLKIMRGDGYANSKKTAGSKIRSTSTIMSSDLYSMACPSWFPSSNNEIPPNQLPCLASERRRPRVSVACGNRVIDVDQDARIRSTVSPWERNEVLRRRAAATSNLELSARQIELCASLATRSVQSNVLIAHQVLSGSDTLGNRNVVVRSSFDSVRL